MENRDNITSSTGVEESGSFRFVRSNIVSLCHVVVSIGGSLLDSFSRPISARKASTVGKTFLLAYSSNVLRARGVNAFVKADPSTIIAEASGLASRTAILASKIEASSDFYPL